MARSRKTSTTSPADGASSPEITKLAPRRETKTATKKPIVFRGGVAVSPGVAIGRAYCIHDIFIGEDSRPLNDADVLQELARYDAAREKTEADLRAVYKKVREQLGEQHASIFQAHEAILHDPSFTAKVRAWVVDSKLSAAAALQRLSAEYTQLFASAVDQFIKDRLADVRDVIIRLTAHLDEGRGAKKLDAGDLTEDDEPSILIAGELVPSHVFTLGDREVAGIVTEAGGRTSHAAILARSRGIPAVSGVEEVLKNAANGDCVVVDGRNGHVILNPDYETLVAYRKLQREFANLKDTLAHNCHSQSISADGEVVQLQANISGVADARAACGMGASGVGLYRTEYLFLTHPDVPDEEEQYQAYCDAIAAAPNRRITIRTLDVGGDKKIAYIGDSREANPFLGWRSIRISFEHPQFFLAQIRAVLRAAAEDDAPKSVRLMFPMVTTVEEMRKIRSFVHRAERQLIQRKVPFARVPIGMMLEVPAAAVSIDVLLEESDFVSIGSNDLVQYLMAADRDNPKVSALCDPFSPAVLQVLTQVIAACRAANKPVTLCGEIAAAPKACVLLFGMGLRSFSMSPAFVPIIKDLLGKLKAAHAEAILKQVLKLRTTAQIARFMDEQIQQLAPNLAILGS
ncbi:MAG: phosphoenolpyruvate--protein phosphotransferase [Planctomycetia bacterium]|nr:phosphoenolpyruvate--protein phosphotransferase [Planctomycetia bacterium]